MKHAIFIDFLTLPLITSQRFPEVPEFFSQNVQLVLIVIHPSLRVLLGAGRAERAHAPCCVSMDWFCSKLSQLHGHVNLGETSVGFRVKVQMIRELSPVFVSFWDI